MRTAVWLVMGLALLAASLEDEAAWVRELREARLVPRAPLYVAPAPHAP
ncbi:MAG TPA: hypothetical protein VLG10_11720 [Methylomirabilota bacterium]|nr:hypothetical protein [Methylomirabilota bacterium]